MSLDVEDVPEDVSSVGISGMFRSPPTISCPSKKRMRESIRLLRNASWRSFGAYKFAKVTFLSPIRLSRYRKRPSLSV